jgi:Alginate export
MRFNLFVVRHALACLVSSLLFVSAVSAHVQHGPQTQQTQQPPLAQPGQPAPPATQGQVPTTQGQQEQPAAQAPQEQYGQPSCRPQYLDLVYDEDWSHIAQCNQHDFFDPIKYIPLGKSGAYLTLGGEIRERWDNWHEALFGYTPATWLNGSLQRYLLSADFHFGKYVRFFTQVDSSLEFGKTGGPWYTDKDVFEFHQAFLDLRTSENKKHYLLLRLGRQEVALGADHFVSTGDFFNVRHFFDGAKLEVGQGDWTWIGFAMKPDIILPGAFDDVPEHGRTVWGGGFFHPSPLTKRGRIGAFYVGMDTKQQLWQRGLGREERHTLGARLEGNPGAWDYAYEGILQVGTFDQYGGPSNDIRAWAFTSDTGYTWVKAKGQHYPRAGLRSNITSGDSGKGALGTFNPLFPDTAYSSRLSLIGPSNVIDVTPTFRLALTRRIYALSEWSFFWRQKTTDAIYSPGLLTTPPTSGVVGYIEKPGNYSDARYIGNQIGVGLQVTLNSHFTWTAGYNYFSAGAFIKQTPPGKDTGYFVSWLTYRF